MTPWRTEIRSLSRLALPVVVAQVCQMMLGMVDIWMVVIGMGVVLGIDPLVSQAHGAGEPAKAGRALHRGILAGVIMSVPITVIWMNVGPILRLMGQDPTVAALGQTYAEAQVWSAAPFLVFNALRQYLLGRGDMWTPLWIIVAANLANGLFNWAFIFGRLGFPAMGVWGAGLATGSTRVFMTLALLGIVRLRGAWVPWTRRSFSWKGLQQVFVLGLPLAFQLSGEVWAFSASSVFAGWLSGPAVAGHVIVLRCASLAFMFPLGVGIATATRVGHLIGAGDNKGATRAAWIAMAMGCGLMVISALVFILFGSALAATFTDDATVIALAASIFPVAAAFALFDGAQVVAAGVLRGMGTPRPAALANFAGYYILALPFAYLFGVRRDSLPGIWWGLAVGLAFVSVALVAWIRVRGPETVRAISVSD
ncbi:MAG: MATE family efflux transporter [Planctomycetota bacterium]